MNKPIKRPKLPKFAYIQSHPLVTSKRAPEDTNMLFGGLYGSALYPGHLEVKFNLYVLPTL